MTTKLQNEMKHCSCRVAPLPPPHGLVQKKFLMFICGNAHWPLTHGKEAQPSSILWEVFNACMNSTFEKYAMWQLTSFLRSLLSLCRCHLMTACGERAWHSRKVLLPSTPYCTISRVFLLAAGQIERQSHFHGNQNTHYHEFLSTKISVVANQRSLSATVFMDYHKAARTQSL